MVSEILMMSEAFSIFILIDCWIISVIPSNKEAEGRRVVCHLYNYSFIPEEGRDIYSCEVRIAILRSTRLKTNISLRFALNYKSFSIRGRRGGTGFGIRF